MSQCPLAYADPCSECAQYGRCCPSQAIQKLADLEDLIRDLKNKIQDMADKK